MSGWWLGVIGQKKTDLCCIAGCSLPCDPRTRPPLPLSSPPGRQAPEESKVVEGETTRRESVDPSAMFRSDCSGGVVGETRARVRLPPSPPSLQDFLFMTSTSSLALFQLASIASANLTLRDVEVCLSSLKWAARHLGELIARPLRSLSFQLCIHKRLRPTVSFDLQSSQPAPIPPSI